MSRPKGGYYISEYQICRSMILGNYGKIVERHPNDTIMMDHLNYMISGMVKMIALCIEEENAFNKSKKEVLK